MQAERLDWLRNRADGGSSKNPGRIFFGSFLEFIPFFTGYEQKK